MIDQGTAEAIQKAATYLMATVVGGGTLACACIWMKGYFKEFRAESDDARALKKERERTDKERESWQSLFTDLKKENRRLSKENEMLKMLLRKNEELRREK